MGSECKTPEIFKYGAHWLRADFHLHTRADKEFKYTGEDNSFVSDYIAGLKSAGIGVGAITNHNKFDAAEFKALRKKARENDICLLPGVELSVNDGANGIHTLLVFSEEWLPNGQDYINQFLNIAFEGKTPDQYENENGRSSLDLITTIKKLEGYHRDFFVIFAHVEQNSGLWKEMNGGRLEDLGKNEDFKRRTIGFQKVQSHDKPDNVCRTKVKIWLKDWYPAEVEGSDCKSVSDIGKGRKSFIKVGAFSYDTVKFALIDHLNRTAPELKDHTHSRILNIRFTGGTLTGQELHFAPELNTLIGIRGSGKSSILEVLRYAVDIPFGEKAGDAKYKQDLVGFTMGSGGKVEIDVIDRHGQPYTIRRVWKEPYPEVLIEGTLQPGVSIRETVLHKPIYFGQKDLSSTGEGFETDLVDKLLGSKLDDVRHNIARQKQRVAEAVDRLDKVANVQDQIEEQKKIKQDTEHRLKFYAAHGVEEKLQKRLDFDRDIRTMKKGIQITEEFVFDIESLLARHEDDIRNFKGYESTHNSELFKRFYTHYETYITFVEQIKAWLTSQGKSKQGLSDCRTGLDQVRKGMVEAFAQIERKLGEELKSCGTQNISSEEFLGLKKKLAMANQLISALQNQEDKKKGLWDSLRAQLHELNDLYHQEFHLIKTELDKVGSEGASISITSGYKEDKSAFLEFMKSVFKGSGIRETTYQGIVEAYTDFIAIFNDFENAKKFLGSNPHILTDLFKKNLKTLLNYQTPNKFTIMYRGKELKHHSLGQRASALILFVLSQQENDVIIIDQPEDDLDNQTIYEDVIKLIRRMKPQVQFIFATHNPNIPVLGDADQVHACSFMDNTVSVSSGSVDSQTTQRTIVDIMEGGQEAFNRRKEIYQIWKP